MFFQLSQDLAGFRLDIDSRDCKILVMRNKGWRGRIAPDRCDPHVVIWGSENALC